MHHHTIDKILENMGYSKRSLKVKCKKCKCCNGCGGKGGISYSKLMQALPYFHKGKGKRLMEDIEYLCMWHDIQYHKGGGVLTFIKVNFDFSYGIFKLTKWTNIFIRWIVFLIVFMGLNIFGIKYYKRKKHKKNKQKNKQEEKQQEQQEQQEQQKQEEQQENKEK